MNPRRARRIYVIGAGLAGTTIAREIALRARQGNVVAFLDDDPGKIGTRVDGVPVLGPIADVLPLTERQAGDEALIAMPSAPHTDLTRIHRTVLQAGFDRIRIVPSVAQLIDGVHLVQTREINPEDLLGRDAVKIDLKSRVGYLRGARVLVTGAGGSIGSELCRQLLIAGVERLYLLGQGENSIYEIESELRRLQAGGVGEATTVVPVLGDLRNEEHIAWLVRRLRASVVFHAAAYKHVPMVEANPVAGVENNVVGTWNLVRACRGSEHLRRMVIISTDKVVEPVSVYGATKALAESCVLAASSLFDGAADQRFMAVRFGNVLGSRGSIVPLLERQIREGGPITITDYRMRRYFMTIPEAAALVIIAGGAGKDAGLYVLDMGEPVAISDLARQMIRFHGMEPDRDIEIREIGMRTGEKLIEHLTGDHESVCPGPHERIGEVRGPRISAAALVSGIPRLREICFETGSPDSYRNRRLLREELRTLIPSLPLQQDEPIH